VSWTVGGSRNRVAGIERVSPSGDNECNSADVEK